VERIISFTAEAIYSSAASPLPWGPQPDAGRDWDALAGSFPRGGKGPTSGAAGLLALTVGPRAVQHAAVGASLAAPLVPPPLPAFASGNLSDGLTGGPTPFAPQWLGFEDSAAGVDVVLDLGRSVQVRRV
jgi:hypothetical protein